MNNKLSTCFLTVLKISNKELIHTESGHFDLRAVIVFVVAASCAHGSVLWLRFTLDTTSLKIHGVRVRERVGLGAYVQPS